MVVQWQPFWILVSCRFLVGQVSEPAMLRQVRKPAPRLEKLLFYSTPCRVGYGIPMSVAHFVQRYPPALGGSEAYFARLSRYLAAGGDRVTVFTTTALALEAFWSVKAPCLPAG